MLSTCNDTVDTVEAQVLDAAAQCVVDYGFARVTLAEIARRAEVSRPTIYRRWPDMNSVLTERINGSLGTNQYLAIAALEDGIARGQAHGSIRHGNTRELAAMVLLTVQSVLQSGELVESILDGDSLATELAYMLNGYLTS